MSATIVGFDRFSEIRQRRRVISATLRRPSALPPIEVAIDLPPPGREPGSGGPARRAIAVLDGGQPFPPRPDPVDAELDACVEPVVFGPPRGEPVAE